MYIKVYTEAILFGRPGCFSTFVQFPIIFFDLQNDSTERTFFLHKQSVSTDETS